MSFVPEDKIKVFALAVATGTTVRQWATDNGVPLSTAYRWSGRPGFRKFVEQVRADLVKAAVGQLAGHQAPAVAALRRIIDPATGATDGNVISAARSLIGLYIDLQTHAELSARIAELERQAAQS